jgi:hypothetical protein
MLRRRLVLRLVHAPRGQSRVLRPRHRLAGFAACPTTRSTSHQFARSHARGSERRGWNGSTVVKPANPSRAYWCVGSTGTLTWFIRGYLPRGGVTTSHTPRPQALVRQGTRHAGHSPVTTHGRRVRGVLVHRHRRGHERVDGGSGHGRAQRNCRKNSGSLVSCWKTCSLSCAFSCSRCAVGRWSCCRAHHRPRRPNLGGLARISRLSCLLIFRGRKPAPW